MGTPNGLPPTGVGWVDTFSKLIVTVGFPVVVAGVLLWFMLTKFQDNIMLISERMTNNAEAARQLVATEQATQAELHLQTVELQTQTALMKQFLELRQRQAQPPQ